MPYWSIYCIYCSGYISDALMECIPMGDYTYAEQSPDDESAP